MSLIGDALRKARQEAAERESDRKGILFSAKIAEGPTRSNLGLGLALGALIAVTATVAGGAAVWWILGGAGSDRDQRSAAVTATGTGAGTGTGTAAIVEPASESASESSVSGSDGGSDSGRGSEQHRQPATAFVSSPSPTPPPSPLPAFESASALDQPSSPQPRTTGSATADTTESASDPTTETGFVGKEGGEEIYILEADLGNGVSLSLDFLIYRDVDPFAEINGVEVHLGGTIEGYRVKAIERDRVTLSNGRRTVVLRAP